MNENIAESVFDIRLRMPSTVDETTEVTLSVPHGMREAIIHVLNAAAASPRDSIEEDEVRFFVDSLPGFLAAWTELNSSHTTTSRTLAQLIQVWRLAQIVVKSRDVFAGVVVPSLPLAKAIVAFRETARAADDALPSWGSGNQTFLAYWVPQWTIDSLVAARHALMAQVSGVWTADEVDWLLIRFVDFLVRKATFRVVDSTESNAPSYRVMYRGEADVFQAWMTALQGEERSFHADGWLIARAMRQSLQKSGWADQAIDDETGASLYQLTFSLHPPEGVATSADWYVSFHIRHRYSGHVYPLADWWRQQHRVWQLYDTRLVQPDSWILPKLREAGQVCPQIANALDHIAPSGCVIAADDVYTFLTESAPRIRSLGFQLETPEVLRNNGTRVRVRVQVKRTKKDARKSGGTVGQQWFDANQIVEFDWSVVIDDEEISRDAFSKMVSDQTPFIHVNGSWRLVPVEDILKQIEELGISGRQEGNVLDFSRAILMTSEEDEVSVDVEYEPEAIDVEQMINVFTEAVHPNPLPVPSGFQGTLRHYQQFGFEWLFHLRSVGFGACLADDMGLGKTIQVLAYLLQLKETGEAKNVHLLVCPTSLLANWQAELQRFAPSLRVYVHHGAQRELNRHVGNQTDVDLVMTTYATLVRDLEQFADIPFDAVIVDEAQNIKNATTKQAQAIRELTSNHRIALTGTPIENRLEELWALMDFLNPGYLASATWFRKTFADAAIRNAGSATTKLQLLLRPVLLRRRKTDPDIQTELPEKWEVDERALLTSEQAAMYQAFVDQLFQGIRPEDAGAMSRRGQILATLVRLKQVCDHPCLISGGVPSVRRSGKLRQLMELLQTVIDEGECALVFTQFRDMGEILCDAIASEFQVRPQFLHGGLSAAVRGQMVEAFQNGSDPSPILVLSLRAGGVGLNLTRANHVFHFDRWWNPAVEDQATDRAYRIGQTKDVQVHKMICSGTLEERIDQLISSKRELSQAVVGAGNDWVTELDDDALRALFTLGPQSVWEEDDA